jgi:hypothetical protein
MWDLPAQEQEDGEDRSDIAPDDFRNVTVEAIATSWPTPAKAGVTAGGADKQGPLHHPVLQL